MAVTKRTIFNFFGGYYFCESTDEKPTNVKVNDRILELDTAREYFWDGSEWVLCGSVVYYPISATVTNGTTSGASKIASGQTVEVTIVPSSGYAVPTSVTVEGATASYNATTGVITLSEVTGDVSITAACVAVFAISVSVTNGSYSGDTTILDGGTANVTIAADTDYVLPSSITVSGASYTYDDTTGAIALSEPTGAVSISAVCEVPQSYPAKGDIINIDMDGDGTDEQYLVLKANGSVAEVLARVTPSSGSSIQFAISGQVYESNALDVYLNTTYYATLSADAKAAIVDKTFRQESWYWGTGGNPNYQGVYNTNNTHYNISLGNASFGNEITRHVYALSVQDVIDYLEVTPLMTYDNTSLNMANVREMFNTTSDTIWSRSACTDVNDSAMSLRGDIGAVGRTGAGGGERARPAFQIDLSKITWSPVQ